MTEEQTLVSYYREQGVLPTYGRFVAARDLGAHDDLRTRLFTDKLHLPPRVFRGARLLELGPDAGENSLVFARWGADCTLVEPNAQAHPVIRDYFERFGLADRLRAVEASDLMTYPAPATAEGRFDLVDAEGFIYTLRPTSAWIEKLGELVRKDGFVVLSYYEAFAGLLELVWKVIQTRFRELTGASPLDSARRLFTAKWESIPHKRGLDAWTMDVLENPFVRLEYFLDAKSLCDDMRSSGFRLYSSWPRYEGGLDVHWFKRDLDADEHLRRQRDFITRSRLSHAFGRTHFLVHHVPGLEETLRSLLEAVDSLIDRYDAPTAGACAEALVSVAEVLASDGVLAEPEDTAASLGLCTRLRELVDLLARGSADEIVAFLDHPVLVHSWGNPAHFAVFRKED